MGMLNRLFGRTQPTGPIQPRRLVPTTAGAYLFTLRSVPQHYEGIKDAIESTGEARVYFGEPLAYLKGQGVSLFRVEAGGFGWLENLYTWWRETERNEAVGFDIKLYVENTRFVANLGEHTPAQIEELIRRDAPRNEHPEIAQPISSNEAP
jgi:hypothetical protein